MNLGNTFCLFIEAKDKNISVQEGPPTNHKVVWNSTGKLSTIDIQGL